MGSASIALKVRAVCRHYIVVQEFCYHAGVGFLIHSNSITCLMTQTQKEQPPAAFEESLEELENIVQRMEQGEQSLDQTIRDFERGMQLAQQCQESLDAAQLKVDRLLKKNNEDILVPDSTAVN